MRGRGRRSRGRGRFPGRGKGNETDTLTTQKLIQAPTTGLTLSDHMYDVGDPSNAGRYIKNTRFIMTHIRKTYNYGARIAQSLEERRIIDESLPVQGTSTSTDQKVADRENEQFKEINRLELKAYVEDKRSFKLQMEKVYGLLLSQCSQQLQHKIETSTEFASKIKNNPIELLGAIERYCVSAVSTRNPYDLVVESWIHLIQTKQFDDESVLDYTQRFLSAKDMYVAISGGPHYAKSLVLDHPNYDEADALKVSYCRADVAERLLTMLFIKNTDMTRFGSFVEELQSQQSLKNDQYPRTILAAQEILEDRNWDKRYHDQHKRKGQKFEKSDKSELDESEVPKQITTDEVPELSFQQLEIHCWCCGKKGHRSTNCPSKEKIPKEQWAASKVKAVQHMLTDRDGNSTIASENQRTARSAVPNVSKQSDQTHDFTCLHQVCLQQAHLPELGDWLLLDSASSVDLFCNRRYVIDIHPCGQTLSLASTGGMFTTNLKATVPGYGLVWFSEKAISNIFSLSGMMDRFRVTMDSEVSHTMVVNTPKRDMRFIRLTNNLFVYKPRKTLSDGVGSAYGPYTSETFESHVCNTVLESERVYSDRQLKRAEAARILMHTLAYPTVRDMKAILKMNSIKNCPVTEKDIDLAVQVYGSNVASLKGKTTRRKPLPVIEDVVSLPPELINAQRDVELSIDTMFVNGMAFLTTISSHIRYRTAQWIPNRTVASYSTTLATVLTFYKRAGLKVRLICADQEFKATLDAMQDEHGFTPNYASAQEHVPAAERNNRVIEERVRAIFHGAPYKALPQILLKYVVTECARRLNFFPAKGGCSDYYSPREILHHVKLDFFHQCQFPILGFVQAHDEPDPSNSLQPRTLDCIYLRPAVQNIQGGHEVYNLATKRVITRRKLTLLPVSAAIIHAVETIARSEGQMPLKITSKGGQVISDSVLIAGVGEQRVHGADVAPLEEPMREQEAHEEDVAPIEAPIEDESVNDQPSDESVKVDDDEDDDDELLSDSENPRDADEMDLADEHGPTMHEPTVRRSGRNRHPPVLYEPTMHGQSYDESTVRGTSHIQIDPKLEDYSREEAAVLSYIMTQFNERMCTTNIVQGSTFVTTYSLKKGLQQFGDRGKQATIKEMQQLHDRRCFQPIHKNTITPTERKRVLESLIFLVEKRDGTVKARHCANGSTQRDYMQREDVSSPTVSTESVLLTAVIEAKEARDVATCDIPNAFIQTDVQARDEDGNRTIMKIRGTLVDFLCEMDPLYRDYIVEEGNQHVLYVHITKAIYGLLVSAMLFYRKLRDDLVSQGFEVNPYDPCVANKIVDGKQLTVCWHVDDLKASHINPLVIDNFLEWVKVMYGSIGEVKITRGKIHRYLGMTLDYSVNGQVSIGMTDYVEDMINGFPVECLDGKKVSSPWNENLFTVQEDSPRLSSPRSAVFHTVTAQGLFLCKRARPDICPAIAYLTTRVTCSTASDWEKLTRMIKFLKQTAKDRLTLSADGSGTTHWHVDAAFAVHPDFRSHTGAVMTMGRGAITAISRKQGLNTRSSTEAELVAADEVAGPILWTKQFLEAQGYPTKKNVLYQDNRSAILLENNGRKSAGKRSRHLNIRLFFVTDQIQKGNIQIEYCPTDDMIGDYMTKPLHGKKFASFRNTIMNLPMTAQIMMGTCMMGNALNPSTIVQQECVESSKSKSNLKLNSQDRKEEAWILVEARSKRKGRL